MPYIKQAARKFYDEDITELIRKLDTVGFPPGDLNYVITRLCNASFEAHSNYHTANEIVGALECAKQEFYRRRVVPLEDLKIQENGDV